METRKILKSGEFLVSDIESKDIFIPEELNEEQLMIAQTCQDFLNTEVYPNADKMDKQDRELMKEILKKSGELGLMGISIPEEYNGFGQSFVITDACSRNHRCRIFIFGCFYGTLRNWYLAHHVLRH